jgi:flagellar basal-body rod protein FlgG
MAATGALAYQKRMEILSNNIANANTVGFKQDKTLFRQHYQSALSNVDPPEATDTATSQAPEFWFEVSTRTDFSTGPLKTTGNRFDLAIVGTGFFCVETPEGILYTRRGDFGINADGTLVTREGRPLLGDGGEITVDSQADVADPGGHEFLVHSDGTVEVDGNSVGKLRIVQFSDARELEKTDGTYFIAGPGSGNETPATDYRISQGALELSNVDAVRMMTELIEVLRGYEAYQKVIRSVDEVNSRAINEIGKTS